MKKKALILSAFAVILLICFTVPQALAYFTDQARGEGTLALTLGDKTEIQETFKDWVKHVSITNDKDSMPVWIRCRAYAGVTYSLTASGTDWEKNEDGWWYYMNPVPGNQSTSDLDITISGIPETELEEMNFNVAVVYESIPVRYQADGSVVPEDPQAADWYHPLDTGTDTTTGTEDGTTGGGES